MNGAQVPFALGYELRTRQLHKQGSRSYLIKVVPGLSAKNEIVVELGDSRLF